MMQADEMGLGKTAQLCVHFCSLARAESSSLPSSSSSSSNSNNSSSSLLPKSQAKPIFLIVCPATVLQHWLKELHTWSPEMRVVIFHNISKTGKKDNVYTSSRNK